MEPGNWLSDFHVHSVSLQVFLRTNSWKRAENAFWLLGWRRGSSPVFFSVILPLFMLIHKSWRKDSYRTTLHQNGVRLKGSSSSTIYHIYVPLKKKKKTLRGIHPSMVWLKMTKLKLSHMLLFKYRWSGLVYTYRANCWYKVEPYTYKPANPF